MKMTEGKVIECRAAIAWEPNKPLSIEKVEVSPPQKGEVRIKIHYTAICHTDIFAWEGNASNLRFPIILGHEGAGIVESVGPGVESVHPGDTVIPSPNPHCQKCKNCQNPNTNICDTFFVGSPKAQIMDDGKSRFKCKGKEIFHFFGLSTFSELIVVREECVCKINPKAPLDKVCLIGCGVTTGYGAPFNSSVVTPGSNVGIWGLGAIGLATILGCKDRGAKNIVAIDTNGERLENGEFGDKTVRLTFAVYAKKFGATHFLNPKEPPPECKTLTEYLIKKFDGGLDFAFEASGNTEAMVSPTFELFRNCPSIKCAQILNQGALFDFVLIQAIECTKLGTGQTTILGASAKKLQISVSTILFGRTVKGCVAGGYKAKEAMPMLVEKYLDGKLMLEEFISWRYSLEEINKGIEHLCKSEGIRSVIKMAKE